MHWKHLHREDLIGSDFVSQLILLGGSAFMVVILVFVLLTAIVRGAMLP